MISKIILKSADTYTRFRRLLLVVVIIGIALYSLQKYLWSTQNHGIGVRTDSVAYLWSAENLVKGLGIGRLDGAGKFRPYTHWPPLYPIILAGINLTGFSILDSARIFGAICVVFLTIVTGLTIAKLTNQSPWYAAGALFILNNSPFYWDTTYYAMTEPLFMVLYLSTLLLLQRYLECNKRFYLILSSLLMGLALLTRYIGFSIIIIFWLYLFLHKNKTLRAKIGESFILGILAFFPSFLWLMRNVLVSGTVTNRSISYANITTREWTLAGNAIISWFDPILKSTPMGFAKPISIIILAFLISGFIFRYLPQHENNNKTDFMVLIAFNTIAYTIFTLIARYLFDPSIPINEHRIQYPIYIGVFLLLLYVLYRFQIRIERLRWFLPAIVVSIYLFGAWIFYRGYRNTTINFTSIGHNAGLGLVRLKDDAFLKTIEGYPLNENRYFTDNIEKLYYLSSFYSYTLTDTPSDEIESILSRKNNHGVVIVLFDQKAYGPEYLSLIPGLHQIYQGTADVYAVPGN